VTIYDIYTDGSCSGNPGPGGWGAIVMDGVNKSPLSGGEASTTNNRMEMLAAIEGLSSVSSESHVTIHSDSQYLVNTMTKNWKRNANQDLWARLDILVAERAVKWEWVRGHDGHSLNEAADRLAVAAMSGFKYAGARSSTPAGGAPAPEPASLTHVDAEGNARMVDVGDKPDAVRTAVAGGTITMHPDTLALILQGKVEKGDVFTIARIAGINAAKHTWELIPLAHQIPLSHISVDFESAAAAGVVTITASSRTNAKTGVEMEALAAVSITALTIYDMCKAVDRAMVIGQVRLLEKRGGTHGDYTA
jgi:cyclic pyranopterin phosphate synthase